MEMTPRQGEFTREALWNVNVSGCDEHRLVHILRTSETLAPELDDAAQRGVRRLRPGLCTERKARRRLSGALSGAAGQKA